jgi:molybdopterin molybdotransferase
MRGFKDRAVVEDVLSVLKSQLSPLSAEELPLKEACDRILASSITSTVAVPSFDRAAMDGYALRGTETFGAGPYNPLEFSVVGLALPGKAFEGKVAIGQAVKIMTGAPLPAGADAVVQAENAAEDSGPLGSTVRITEPVPPGKNIGRRGEDIQPGGQALPAGRRIRPQDVGLLASIGCSVVRVVRQPVVAILTTGDEILPAGSQPTGYRIVDSNSPMLAALVRKDGGIPVTGTPIPDQYPAVKDAILSAHADLLLVSGGSSVGQEDHAPRILAEVGKLCFHGLALRPASPTGMGFLGRTPIFLMPGNPVSCLCAYDLIAGRATRLLGSRSWELPYRTRTLPLARKIASVVGRLDYVRVKISDNQVEPLSTSGAAILSSTTRADGFVLVPADSEGFGSGATVEVHLYD